MIASSLIFPCFLAVSIALLKSTSNWASLFPNAESEPNCASCLSPTPTPFPKAPPEKVGPVRTTGLPDF